METMITVMQMLCVAVLVAGSALTLQQLMRQKPARQQSPLKANDFEIDFRRVLAFNKLRSY